MAHAKEIYDRKHDALQNYALLICKEKRRTNSGPTLFNIDIISDVLSCIRRYRLAVLINRKVTTELRLPKCLGKKEDREETIALRSNLDLHHSASIHSVNGMNEPIFDAYSCSCVDVRAMEELCSLT